MPLPKPIRYDADNWLCMRNDATLPKAIIRRVTAERFRVVIWALESSERQLVGYYESLGLANDAVLYDRVHGGPDGPANGLGAARRE